MTSYLKERLCSGFCPQRIRVAGAFMRDALVSRMMLDRDRVRLICAPTCMGKTTLAFSYAQVVFSFQNVLWLDASHPCVLRDLDDGSLVEKIASVMKQGKGLVVLDDVSWLGSVRKQRFAALCADLLDRGVEVVVSCIPACDPFGGDWHGCLAITSPDLLFSDGEIEEMRVRGVLPPQLRNSQSLVSRVPGVRDRSTGSIERFLSAQFMEARSAFESVLTMTVALLGSGQMDDLSRVLGVPVTPDDLRCADLRPYVRLHEFRNRFDADGFPVEEAVRAFLPYAKKALADMPDPDVEAFLCRAADQLQASGQFDRATKLVIAGCSPTARASWLCRTMGQMLDGGQPLPVFLVHRSLRGNPVTRHPSLSFGNAFAECQMGDVQAGVRGLMSVARRRDAKPADRLSAATLAVLYGNRGPAQVPLGDSFGSCCAQERAAGNEANPLVVLWNAVLEGDTGMAELGGFHDEQANTRDWLLAAACCLRSMRHTNSPPGFDARELGLLSGFARRVAVAVEACLDDSAQETAPLLAARELEALDLMDPGWSHFAAARFAHMESRLRRHREAYLKLCETVMPPDGGNGASAKAPKVRDGASGAIANVPLMEVRLFGGFDVTIGGQPVDALRMSRLKVRALLALMVLEAGKDLSCERLGAILWPESSPDKARRNFYSIFSMLNRALETPEGDNVYLERSQGVCRLNAACLKSDAGTVLETCNQLRFGRLAPDDAYLLLEQLCSVYRGELLPGETVVPAIDGARRQWRSRVVDSVLFAARDLQSRGEVEAALELAKAAVDFDSHREDCYELLMILQMTCAQRTNAIETFFTYNRMNRELGLSASARMVDLYNCILNDERQAMNEIMRMPAYA